MHDLLVIVPSRGRPAAAKALLDEFRATCTANTGLVFALDDDDPTKDDYYRGVTCTGPNKNMVEALNRAAVAHSNDAIALGFMGDDHRPRTKGWDSAYLEALWELGTGIVYGDDLLQGKNLPTQCAMTADIVRVLGYMAPPTLTHLAVDNWWLTLGTQAECVRFLPQVVVEHLHPVVGKARWDEGYRRVNAPEMYDRDLREFNRICREELPMDVAKVRTLRGAHV